MTEGISYKKCTYNEEERKMREKDCRIYRIRQERIKKLAEEKTEENLWQTIIAFQEYPFMQIMFKRNASSATAERLFHF